MSGMESVSVNGESLAAEEAEGTQGTPQEPQEGSGSQEQSSQEPQLPEKFKTVDDLVKAYNNLEAKFSQSRQQETTQESGEESGESTKETQQIDFDAYVSKGLAGELTDEDYQALEAAGFSKSMIDRSVAGAKAMEDQLVNTVYEAVGGEDSYKQMMEWAANGLSDQEKAAYDEAVNSGNPFMAKLAAQGLQSLYRSAEGTEPTRQVTGRPGPTNGGAYNSWQEVTRDMQDPRYAKDPAFRAQVEQKLANSPF